MLFGALNDRLRNQAASLGDHFRRILVLAVGQRDGGLLSCGGRGLHDFSTTVAISGISASASELFSMGRLRLNRSTVAESAARSVSRSPLSAKTRRADRKSVV